MFNIMYESHDARVWYVCVGPKQADRFNKQLASMVTTHKATIEALFGLLTSLSTHGIRKGSASMAASSPSGPSIIAICLRADWKLGAVLQVYLRLEKGGDQFVGRTVALLPINSADFGILPPHFVDTTNPIVITSCEEAFGELWKHYPSLRGNLLLGLASVIYHRVFLLGKFGKVCR